MRPYGGGRGCGYMRDGISSLSMVPMRGRGRCGWPRVAGGVRHARDGEAETPAVMGYASVPPPGMGVGWWWRVGQAAGAERFWGCRVCCRKLACASLIGPKFGST